MPILRCKNVLSGEESGAESGEEHAESIKEGSRAFLSTAFGVLTVGVLRGEARYKAKKKYDEAEYLLYESVLTLLRHEQNESAFELARILITLYNESKKEVTDEPVEKVSTIIKNCNGLSDTGKEFVQEALSWTASKHKFGHPKLQLIIATKFWQEKNYGEARKHFIYTNEGSQCAAFLIEYHVVAGFPGEVDLFVTQAVLQILCLQNTPTANSTFFGYTTNHPGIKKKCRPYKQPLLNFIAFLLLVIEKGNLEQYTILCEQYQPSIRRDPTYPKYLDKIGQIFFGLPPPKKQAAGIQGIIGELMESIFTTGESSSSVGEDVIMETEDVD